MATVLVRRIPVMNIVSGLIGVVSAVSIPLVAENVLGMAGLGAVGFGVVVCGGASLVVIAATALWGDTNSLVDAPRFLIMAYLVLVAAFVLLFVLSAMTTFPDTIPR